MLLHHQNYRHRMSGLGLSCEWIMLCSTFLYMKYEDRITESCSRFKISSLHTPSNDKFGRRQLGTPPDVVTMIGMILTSTTPHLRIMSFARLLYFAIFFNLVSKTLS
uniref:Uncharacterized protein n=1 Tax=Cacopsylla melanoneura TaxID=428564 RepID=A0A8D9BSR2_9HEMI